MTPPPQIEYKTLALSPVLETKASAAIATAPETGVVEAYVAVTGVRDDVGDIIVPGAFSRTLKTRHPKMCLGHEWNRPIGEPEEIIELMPGDPRLPRMMADGKPWPASAGALYTRNKYILDTQDGRDAYAQAKFFGARTAYSIGYVPKDARHGIDPATGEPTRFLHDVDLYEYGPVLHGAHRLAHQKAVKNAAAGELETKVRVVRDSAYWGLPIGTPITPGMKPNGPKAQQRRERGQTTPENVGVVDIEPVDAESEVDVPDPTAPAADTETGSAPEAGEPAAEEPDEAAYTGWTVPKDKPRLKPRDIKPGMRVVIDGQDGRRWRVVASTKPGERGTNKIIATDADGNEYALVPSAYYQVHSQDMPGRAAETEQPQAPEAAVPEAPAEDLPEESAPEAEAATPVEAAGQAPEAEPAEDLPEEEAPEAETSPQEEAPEADTAPYTPTGRTDAVGELTNEQLAAELADAREKERAAPRGTAQAATAKTRRKVLEDEQRKREAATPGGPERQRLRSDVDRFLSTPPRDQPAMAAQLSPEELAAYDTELTARAERLGKPGEVSKSHQVIKDELAKRPAVEESPAEISVEWTESDDGGFTATLPTGHQYEGQQATVGPAENGEWRWSIGSGLGGVETDSGYDTYASAEDAQRAALAPDQADPDRGVGLGRPPRRGLTVPGSEQSPGGTAAADGQLAEEEQRAGAVAQRAEQALADGDALTLGAALRDLGAENPTELATQLTEDPEGGAARLAEIVTDASRQRAERVDQGMAQAYTQASDEQLADELETVRSRLAEMTESGTAPEDFAFQLHGRREQAILREQERRGQNAPEMPEDAPRPDDPAAVAELAAENDALLTEAADTVQGLTEAEDGQLETDDDVAERQERVASLLARADSGALDLSRDNEQTLRTTRADVIGEIRLQDYLTKRDSTRRAEARAARVAAEQDETRLTEAEALEEAAPEAPKPRPGVAGAAEDLADALEGGEEERVLAARARLKASLNRSRATGEAITALRALAEGDEGDPGALRTLAKAIREEARTRRNAAARNQRQVRRFERERLRSLLAEIDAEMSRRGLDFEPLPDTEGGPEDTRSFAERVGVGGTWVFAASGPGTLGTSAQSWTVRGPRYTAVVENSRFFGGTESETSWRWEVTDRDGEVITSGSGRSPDQASARAEVEADLAIQQALGTLAPDTVLPRGDGPFTSSARSEETTQARVQAMSQRLNAPAGTRRNVLSGQRDPLVAPALRPPAVPAFSSVEAVRVHLTERAARGAAAGTEGELLNRFLADVQWDDVILSPGGGLMVTKAPRGSGYVVTHTGTGAEARVLPYGGSMDKTTATKLATVLESLVDDNGNTVDFATDDIAKVKSSTEAWSRDGRKGLSALGEAVAHALLGEQLRNARWNSGPVKSIKVDQRNTGQTNPTRLGYIQSTVSGLASLIGNKPTPEDKHTLDIARGAQLLYHTGAPDAAAVLVRRRAAELRSGETAGQGAQLLENLANGYLSSWAPQASPGERVLNLRTGERVAFADGPEEIRVYRAIGEPRRHADGEGAIIKVADEQTGQRYELRAGGPSGAVSIIGEYDGRQNATLRYVPLGNPEYVVLDPGQQAPATQEELTAAAWAELDSIPAAVLDAAAEIAPETRAERTTRAAVTPRGVRAPRRRSAAAPRRSAPETAAPAPVAGEEKLAIGQARAHERWLGGGLALADTPLPGGFGSLAEAREYARARADELRGTREGQALAFVAGSAMEKATLSPGGHFAVVPHNGTVVHLRSGLTVWGMGDTSQDVDGDRLSTAVAGQVASYMERASFDGVPVDWTADLERIREQLKKLVDQRLDQLSGLEATASRRQANPLVRIGRLALADYVASAKNPSVRDVAGFAHSAADAPRAWFNPGAIARLNPFLESEKYTALSGRRSLHFSGPEYTSETKAGANLARRVATEIQVADALSRVSPLEAVRRLNRLAQEWEGQEIQPREGEALRPADYLRQLATAITDAWDEGKVSSYIRALRANFTGEMTVKNFSVTPKGGDRANGTDKFAAVKVNEQLASSPTIRIFRDADGNLHASFAGRELISFADRNRLGGDAIQINPDNSVRMVWQEKTGYSNGVTLEIPADGWEFTPEGADPEGQPSRPAAPGAGDQDERPDGESGRRPPFPPEEEEKPS